MIRMLILGVLHSREASYGYQVRQELETWQAHHWAHIAYGSIYHALAQMTQEGLLTVVPDAEPRQGPARKRYQLTPDGRAAFHQLVRQAWAERQPVIDPFQSALTFMNTLTSGELQQFLRQRIDQLRAEIAALPATREAIFRDPEVPRHIAENLRLHQAHLEVDLQWSQQLLAQVKRDEVS